MAKTKDSDQQVYAAPKNPNYYRNQIPSDQDVPVNSVHPLLPNPELEALQSLVSSQQELISELRGQINALVDGQTVLSAEISGFRNRTEISVPEKIYNGIEPAQVYCHALSACIQGLYARTDPTKMQVPHIARSHAKMVLDMANAVLIEYVARNQPVKKAG